MPYPADWEKGSEPLPAEWREWAEAFSLLSLSRPAGFGAVGFVPLAEIVVFAKLFNIADVQAFALVMRHLDVIYVEYQNERLENGRSNSGKT